METTRLDCRAYCTPQSSVSIQSYISSCFAPCFFVISSESSYRVALRKSKSSKVRTVCILVMVAFNFFQEEGFRGEPFLFFRGSNSSPCFYSTSFSSNSSPSPPHSGDMEEVFLDFFGLLCPARSGCILRSLWAVNVGYLCRVC
jgi:hypothetical protein